MNFFFYNYEYVITCLQNRALGQDTSHFRFIRPHVFTDFYECFLKISYQGQSRHLSIQKGIRSTFKRVFPAIESIKDRVTVEPRCAM